MKKTLFATALLIVLPTIALAQTQTRERRSSSSDQTTRTDSVAVRDRMVGQKASNHVEKQKPLAESKVEAGSSANGDQSDSITQPAPPNWGNTSVIIRPSRNERPAARESTLTRPVSISSEKAPPKKLVQTTSLVAELPSAPSRILADGNARAVASPRKAALTSTYNVGIGDVLDIRLSNLPTRESTLFTVLKNGVLEYPLLSAPMSVAGLTTDEIANLLGNEIKVIKSARVSVSVRDYASHAVVINGSVDSPGRKVLRREAMPLYAVLAEALPRTEASTATIVRNGKAGDPLALNNDQAMATLVMPGDLIRVAGAASAAARDFLYVGGEVATPGEKPFRKGMTLTQAVLAAGGASRAEKMNVKVSRRNANGFLSSSEYNLRLIEEGKTADPILEAGDRVEVTRTM